MSPRSALVTGGAGFIGGHLVERLVADGWRVRVLDDFSTGCEANLEPVREEVEVIRGDLRNAALRARAMAGAEVVFHEAAVPSVSRSVAEPLETDAVNAHGTLAVMETARRAGVRRVVYATSCAVYGDSEEYPKHEGLPPRPLSPYALQKHVGELYCRLYTELYGLEAVALRYFNVYGPRQDPRGDYAAVIPRFVCACLAGEAPRIFGDGLQTRDFVYVGDVVRANLLAAEAPGAAGRTMNVASGTETSIGDLAKRIHELAGRGDDPIHEAARAGEVQRSVADVSLARELLGYEPQVDLTEGLRRTLEGFRSSGAVDGGRWT